jgi:uncharacterized protein (TIGR02217 family)
MSFIESRPLDNYIALGSSAGPNYQTEIIELSSGVEQRNQAWEYPRHRYVVGISAGKSTKIETLRQLQHTTRGALNGFRFKDFNDYSTATVQGDATAYSDQSMGAGDGVSLTYQLLKNYETGAASVARAIYKPITSLFTLGYSGTAWSVEDDGGRWSVDSTTGVVTFLANLNKTITGAADQGGGVTRLTSVGHLIPNDVGTIHLSAFTGDWAGLNDQRFTRVGSTVNTIDITADSSTYAAYSSNAGEIDTIPQVAEEITWGGEFDVPVRFSSDSIQIQQISPGIEQATIELIEIK